MPDLRGDIRRAIFTKVRDKSVDIMQDAIAITKILGEFSKRHKDFDQLEKLNIELTIPIRLPPGEKKGYCRAVVEEVKKSLNELGGGTTIYYAEGSWLDDNEILVSDDCSVVFTAMPIGNWFKCIPVLQRLIRDEIQTKLLQQEIFMRIDNQTFGKPLNLLGKSTTDEFPSIDEFGGIDPACMTVMSDYEEHPIQTVPAQEIKGNENIQISSGGDASVVSGRGAISATNLTINNNYGPISNELSKEVVGLLKRIERFAADMEDLSTVNITAIDKIGDLEQKLAQLAEETERVEKEVGEVENAPLFLLNQMDTANRQLTKYMSEFRTPRTVAQLMVRLAKPTGGKIYDGCCGDGDLLLEAHRFAETELQNELLQFYGQEMKPYLWNQAKVNFAIQGVEVDLGPSHGSTLHNPHHLGLAVDYVISDIPFGMRLRPKLVPSDDSRWILNGQSGIGSGEVAWILHSLHQLAPSGVCIIHLPVGILFRSDKETTALRKFLIKEKLLSGIVELKPSMHPLTSISTCILILEKRDMNRTQESSRGVFMMNCSEYDGVKKGNYYAFSKHEISSIADAYTRWREKIEPSSADLPPNSKIISHEDIRKKEYILSVKRYIES